MIFIYMFDLKGFRKYKSLKQGDIATVLDVAQPFISMVEKGEKTLADPHMVTLREHYGEEVVDKFYIPDPGSGDFPKELLQLVKKYEERLEKKDQQIEKLINIIDKDFNSLAGELKKLTKTEAAPEENDAGCVDVGKSGLAQ